MRNKKKERKKNMILAFLGSLLLSNILFNNEVIRNKACKEYDVGCDTRFDGVAGRNYNILPFPSITGYVINKDMIGDDNSVHTNKNVSTGAITATNVTFNDGLNLSELDSTIEKLQQIKLLLDITRSKNVEVDDIEYSILDEVLESLKEEKTVDTDLLNVFGGLIGPVLEDEFIIHNNSESTFHSVMREVFTAPEVMQSEHSEKDKTNKDFCTGIY